MSNYFKKHIAIPQDHGSWVFILSPLLIGVLAGRKFTTTTLSFVIAAMTTFMIRQPMTILVKVMSGRRPKTDLNAARFWLLIYSSIITLALLELILEGSGFILFLAIPSIPIFAWHLWLVSKRDERQQANLEIIATGILSLTAPAAYWIGIHAYNPFGWWLWLWTWLQSAASIVYAYLRLKQRELKQQQIHSQDRSGLWKMGRYSLWFTSANLFASLMLGWASIIPPLIFVPFLIQWLETLWGITHPAIGWKPMRIGVRQFIVSALWTVLFIAFNRP